MFTWTQENHDHLMTLPHATSINALYAMKDFCTHTYYPHSVPFNAQGSQGNRGSAPCKYKPHLNLVKAVATLQAKRLFPKVSWLRALGRLFFLRTRNFSVCRMTFLLDFGVRQATVATCPDVSVLALPGGVPCCEHRSVRSTLAFARMSQSRVLARDTVCYAP